MDHDDDENPFRAGRLVPQPGGEWWGALFENPAMGIPPMLTWGFSFDFLSVEDDDVEVPLYLTVEYVPLPAPSWQQLAGHRLASRGSSSLAEAVVNHYLRHRFEAIDLTVVEQDGSNLRVAVIVTGDLDDLGVDPLRADAWLTFEGISVSLPDATGPDGAFARLGEFTDTSTLAPIPDSALRFVPAASA